jgi:Ca-activated chloride channel family protein
VLAAATDDRALLRRVLEDAAPTNGPADWEAAFALAAAGLTDVEEPRAVIISDGALPEALPSLPAEVHLVGVGGYGDNLAITALATREGTAGPQAFLRVVNYSDADTEPLVELSADGVLFDARHLVVPAHGSADLTLTDLPYDLYVLQAQLSVQDALPLDDTAWAVHAPPVSGQVLLISTGNLFLERALGALPGVELVRLAPDQPLPAEPYDLYVYDGVITDTLPSGNLWLIAPSALGSDGFPIEVSGFFTATAITRTASGDPLLRYVDLSELHVLQARAVVPPPGARVLIEAEGGPLLFITDQPERRLAVLTFDLHDSDLPLQVAFPILTANLADWLLPRGAARLPATVRPGDPVAIPLDSETTEVAISVPDGSRYLLSIGEEPPIFAYTEQLGTYLISELDRSGDVLQSAAFAVNLFDETESDIRSRDIVRVGQTEVTAAVREGEGRREFWPWLVGAALGVLAVEWWAYQRGAMH